MHKRTAHNDTEPIEEEQETYFEPPTGQCKDLDYNFNKICKCIRLDRIWNSNK